MKTQHSNATYQAAPPYTRIAQQKKKRLSSVSFVFIHLYQMNVFFCAQRNNFLHRHKKASYYDWLGFSQYGFHRGRALKYHCWCSNFPSISAYAIITALSVSAACVLSSFGPIQVQGEGGALMRGPDVGPNATLLGRTSSSGTPISRLQ